MVEFLTTLDLNTSSIEELSKNVYRTSDVCPIVNSDSLENIVYTFSMLLLLVAGVIGNSLVILAVIMSPLLRKRKTFYFVAMLACSDLLLGVFQIPFKISVKLHDNKFCHNLSACYVLIISDVIGNIASILNLLLIAIDRFVAIKFPFRYNTILSSKHTSISIFAVWLFSILWSLTGIIRWKSNSKKDLLSIYVDGSCMNDNHYFYAVSFLGVYIPVLICIIVIYIIILHIAFTQIHAIEATQVTLTDRRLVVATNDDGTPEIERTQKKRKRIFYKELKATKSVLIVFSAFIICWMPSAIINIMILFNNIFPEINRNNPKLFLFIYYFFIQILPTTSTMCNPLIYSFSNAQFRTGLKDVWSKVCLRRSRYYSTTSCDVDRKTSNSSTKSNGVSNNKTNTVLLWKPD